MKYDRYTIEKINVISPWTVANDRVQEVPKVNLNN